MNTMRETFDALLSAASGQARIACITHFTIRYLPETTTVELYASDGVFEGFYAIDVLDSLSPSHAGDHVATLFRRIMSREQGPRTSFAAGPHAAISG